MANPPLVGMVQHLVATASRVGLVRMIAAVGSGVLVGYAIAIRIIMFECANAVAGVALLRRGPRKTRRV